MYYLVKECWKRGYLRSVIALSKKHCREEFDLDLVKAFPGGSRVVNGLGMIKDKVWSAFPSRSLSEMLFDRYAASKLSEEGSNLVLTPGLLKTAEKAKALGCKTFLYGATPDPRYLLQQIQIERSTFRLKTEDGSSSRSWEMARFAAQLEKLDYIIAISDFAAASYVRHGFPAEKIFVAPLGVDLESFPATPCPSDGYFTCLFVAHADGSTGVLKGLHYLLQAWSELGLKNARLLICGNIGVEVQDFVKRYQGEISSVQFTGRVRNPAEYYQRASVFVFPSVAEGFGKVVLEAMATGRPVITTPIPKPVIRDGVDGFYIPVRDVQALKDKLLYFYNHRDEVVRMGANATEQAQRFTWERFSHRIADIIAEVSARPS
jgi:glycosyltransferase involved in cell wall biosynthesis